MDQTDLTPLLATLSTSITTLESTLQPLLNTPISTTASTLPLLDKAKLYVLTTYAIESLLFSSLRLAGTDAKAHPVFTELARVRQYFSKIKAAEEGGVSGRREAVLDKGAAGRFIKHALAGNERYDAERREKGEQERERARLKAEDMGRRTTGDEVQGVRRETEEASSGSGSGSEAEKEERESETPGSKRKRTIASEDGAAKKQRRLRKQSPLERSGQAGAAKEADGGEGEDSEVKGTPSKTFHRRRPGADQYVETIIPRKSHQPPRGRSEAFQALLKGPLPRAEPQERKKKRHRKSKAEASE